MNRLRRLVPLILVTAAAALGFAAYAVRALPAAAPAVTFVSLQGERISAASLRGKVVLVEFWATDCAICLREMPDIAATYQRFRGQGFETVAVAMRHDPPNYVVHYAERAALPFPVALDPMGELAKAFGDVRYTPTRFVIDRRGRIVARMSGAMDLARLHALLAEKLSEPA